jgi:hypothetical protein
LYAAYGAGGYRALTFESYLSEKPGGRVVILRHDVDKKPANALAVAALQHALGIRGTYYFRVVPGSFDTGVIRKVIALGHEIGYHYEDVALCHGDLGAATRHFVETLARFRELYPVKTICMHGSPLSRWDNRSLWKVIDYRDYGITGEPYFDIDFSSGLYITDTGRRWDGDRYSIRDRMDTGGTLRFRTTFDIVAGLQGGTLPPFVMQNFHPQRWTDNRVEWITERVMQRVRNEAKAVLRRFRK